MSVIKRTKHDVNIEAIYEYKACADECKWGHANWWWTDFSKTNAANKKKWALRRIANAKTS